MSEKRVAIYARVSTDGQTTDNQVQELEAVAARMKWEIVARHIDHGISGAKGRDKRPAFDALCRGATRREFDMIMAWSVDRLGRSLQDLVGFMSELQAVGCDLYLHQQALDTSTPAGRAMFQMCGVFAEFERGMIQERVKAGLARAKAHGTKSGKAFGRPRSDKEDAVRAALAAGGKGIRKIAAEIGVGVSVVQRIKAEGEATGIETSD